MKRDLSVTPRHGFFHDPSADPDAYIFGSGELLGEPLQADRDWRPWLPALEKQFGAGWDSFACATYGTFNALEVLFARVFGEVHNYSERFTANVTGTYSKTGNDPHLIAEHIRKITGALPEDRLPFDASVTSKEEYYAPITESLYQKALEFTKEWDFGHDTVRGTEAMYEALKYSPLGCSVGYNGIDENGYWYKSGDQIDGHWGAIVYAEYGKYWVFFDSYEPSIKYLRWDMQPTLVKRYSIKRKAMTSNDSLLISLYKQLIVTLTKLRDMLLQAPTPAVAPVAASKLRFDTYDNSLHSVRVICDEMGLNWNEKALICAVIYQESRFDNKAKCFNKNKAGVITSTDHGICQINDHYHVGKGKKWPSVKQIMDNPDLCVRWMITLYKQRNLKLWVGYSSGAYKKWLPKFM